MEVDYIQVVPVLVVQLVPEATTSTTIKYVEFTREAAMAPYCTHLNICYDF